MTDELRTLTRTLEQAGQPDATFRAIDAATKQLVGHQLFTLLYRDGEEVARVYSNRPNEYPVSGRKRMGPTPWGDHVLNRCQPYLGRDREAIRWAFFDHALIESMGLGSTLNIPIIYDGRCIGTMNLLDAEFHYREEHVAQAAAFAPLLIPAFLEARKTRN